MYIRRAFQVFLHLQSDADRPATDAVPVAAVAERAWPMDHAPRAERPDWTLDWRWFCAETER